MCILKCGIFLLILTSFSPNVNSSKNNRHLTRKKRYLSFPEGAAFSAVWCLTSQMGITDGASIFSEGINWGLVYDLPNDTKPLLDPYSATQKRRNRRDLYLKVEDILTSVGYNGRACILRSLCEASRHFKSKEDSLLYQLLSVIFRFPQDPVLSHEPDDHRVYHWASQIGSRSITDYDGPITEECSDIFQCPFSLIDIALEESGCNYHDVKKLSRTRRYLAFPEGAAFSAVFCLTNLMGITPGADIFSMNINWAIVYELPNETKPLLDVYKPAAKRKTRRDLYGRVEKVLTSMGYDGRSCILRSLCEAGQRFQSKEDSLLYHILGLIFRFPQDVLLNTEPETHRAYHQASQLGSIANNKDLAEYPEDVVDKCSETFKCPFSLIDLALGYYS